MPTYEYECASCGFRFEMRQSMKAEPVVQCPECQGRVHRIVSGGSGFIVRGSSEGSSAAHVDGCSLERTGRTCCGRDERCGKPPCG
jgi:putative FmdB family regulatory protein